MKQETNLCGEGLAGADLAAEGGGAAGRFGGRGVGADGGRVLGQQVLALIVARRHFLPHTGSTPARPDYSLLALLRSNGDNRRGGYGTKSILFFTSSTAKLLLVSLFFATSIHC